jgi:ubiquinone/menaquinone biosynthesis C-methylase UbiE
MTSPAIPAQSSAALAFDALAADYDGLFTRSLIGRAQRDTVWDALTKAFACGDNVLELNCGTGEDAIFLSQNGISVFACDASQQMVSVARERVRRETSGLVRIEHLPIESLGSMQPSRLFDGAFSNFSGLNCVTDLHETARQLARLTAPGAPLLVCLSTRFCAFEIIWFLLHGEFRKARRRTSGSAIAHVGGFPVQLQYPTIKQLRQFFSPWFSLRSYIGVGVAIPPSFAESWVNQHLYIFKLLQAIDRRLHRLPGLRIAGDHVLLSLERVSR